MRTAGRRFLGAGRSVIALGRESKNGDWLDALVGPVPRFCGESSCLSPFFDGPPGLHD